MADADGKAAMSGAGGPEASVCRLLVAAHTGHSPASLHVQPVRTGLFNQTFRVASPSLTYILRIAPPDDAGFLFYERRMMAQEPEVYARVLRETQMPIAGIIAYDDTRTRIDRDYLVMTCLPGQPLSEAVNVTPDRHAHVLRQLGRHLAQLHRIAGDAYGYLGAHRCMEPQRTWADAFTVMWSLLLDDLESCGGYTRRERKLFQDAQARHAELFARPVRSCLLHMDIWAQNILVDDEFSVTGIVDFDRALYGDVEIEFAVLDYCGISEPAFWEGYGHERPSGPAAQVRNTFYLLYELQKYIPIEHWRHKNPSAAQRYKQQVFHIAQSRLGMQLP